MWDITDTRRDQAEQERQRIASDQWLEDHIGLLTNHFISLMQVYSYIPGDLDVFVNGKVNYFRYIIETSIIQETTFFIFGPALAAFIWVCCWRQCRVKNCCRKFLEYLRFNDLQLALLIIAPYANTHLYLKSCNS